jgi:hypothetical protein
MPKLKYKKYWIEVHNRKEKSKPKKNPKHEKKKTKKINFQHTQWRWIKFLKIIKNE